jgi:osmotically-inducible protein OsmY
VAADNTISATIRRKFGADSTLSQYAIGIRTVDRNVTLSGTVGSFPARDRAVQIATDTDDVNGVRNSIMVNTNL